MTQEAAIRDLDNERNRLKDKVLRMEEEREALQSQGQALDDRQRQQIQSLEKVCFSMQVVIHNRVMNKEEVIRTCSQNSSVHFPPNLLFHF